ncbi:MAG TPA: phosphatidate cytidylyltransferase [Gemmatimonadales bacterium]|nr:phosphatidate cytidylyltransferase [Gemmatimonadales bacterium]
MASNMTRRVAFAAVAIPLAGAVLWWGGWPLVVLVAVAGVLGTRELYDLSRRQGVVPLVGLGLTAAALLPLCVFVAIGTAPSAAATAIDAAVLGLLVLLAVALWRRAPGEHPLAAVAVTFFGVLYTGALPCYLIVIRHGRFGVESWGGLALVMFPLVITWTCDTAAMFGGKLVGGPRLAPVISPGKTWAGAVAGVLGAVVVAPLYLRWALGPAGIVISAAQAAGVAAILAVVGQAGDLAESLFKREAGVKDSSQLIPGHGGVLDRFDSLYFVLPAAAFLYRALGVL